MPSSPTLPPTLAAAAAARTGVVSMVVGAGCSLEAPTSLELSSVYATQVHDALVADGILEAGTVEDPSDLAALASTIHDMTASQAAVVTRLPRDGFKYARANHGYLLVAALMAEGVIGTVATLNYDLALTDAVRAIGGHRIAEISGPDDLPYLGMQAIVYLHRNVNESNPEKWILRNEALKEEWRSGWESIVAARVTAAPYLVFAGLGSPAAALTETAASVRAAAPNAMTVYLADPSAEGKFREALELDPENHIQAYWGEFMGALAGRVCVEFSKELAEACQELAQNNQWPCDAAEITNACDSFMNLGLFAVGTIRSNWLRRDEPYAPDEPATRPLIADLITAILILGRECAATSIRFTSDGLVSVEDSEGRRRIIQPVSGCGYRRWAELDNLEGSDQGAAPHIVLASGFIGEPIARLAPPRHIVDGDPQEDSVVSGGLDSLILSTDALCSSPQDAVERLGAWN